MTRSLAIAQDLALLCLALLCQQPRQHQQQHQTQPSRDAPSLVPRKRSFALAHETSPRTCSGNVPAPVLRKRPLALAQETSSRPCPGHVASLLPRKRPIARAQDTSTRHCSRHITSPVPRQRPHLSVGGIGGARERPKSWHRQSLTHHAQIL